MDGCDELISMWLNVVMRVVGSDDIRFKKITRNAAKDCCPRWPSVVKKRFNMFAESTKPQ